MDKNKTKNSDRPPFTCIHLSDDFSIIPKWKKDKNGEWVIPEAIKQMVREYQQAEKEKGKKNHNSFPEGKGEK